MWKYCSSFGGRESLPGRDVFAHRYPQLIRRLKYFYYFLFSGGFIFQNLDFIKIYRSNRLSKIVFFANRESYFHLILPSMIRHDSDPKKARRLKSKEIYFSRARELKNLSDSPMRITANPRNSLFFSMIYAINTTIKRLPESRKALKTQKTYDPARVLLT